MENNSKKKLSLKSAFEALIILLMVALIVFFAVRYSRFKEKPFASELIWTEEALREFENSDGDFVIYYLPTIAISRGIDAPKLDKEFENLANYTVSNMVFFERPGLFQLTVKYPVRDLEDKNKPAEYFFVLEDDDGTQYSPEGTTLKVITGYVYQRLTYRLDLFNTTYLRMIFEKNGKVGDTRLVYNTLDRISEDESINVYTIAYSDVKQKYSFRVRTISSNEPNALIVKADGVIIKPDTCTRSSIGTDDIYFVEFENFSLENFSNITVHLGDAYVNIYDFNKDRQILEDFSTDEMEIVAYYMTPDDMLITPVEGRISQGPNK